MSGSHEHLFWPFPGAFVLRDKNFLKRGESGEDLDLDDRLFVAAHDVIRLDPDERGDEKHFCIREEDGRDTLGDINGFFYLFPRTTEKESLRSTPESRFEPPAPRLITGWYPCVPAIGVGGGKILPVLNKDIEFDERYEEVLIENKGRRPVKKGDLGLVVSATEESGDPDLIFIRGDTELVAPNKATSSYAAGSDVYDLEGTEPDEDRVAKLQTAFRVIAPRGAPDSVLGFVDSIKPIIETKWFEELESFLPPAEVPLAPPEVSAEDIKRRLNSIAIQNGLTGGEEFSFQAKIDNKSFYGDLDELFKELGEKVEIGPWIGLYGYGAGGPDLCGELGDIHTILFTEDGIGCSSGHLSHQTLFKWAGGGADYDATLPFSDRPFPEITDASDFFVRGELLFNPAGAHFWMGTALPGLWEIVIGFPFEESEIRVDDPPPGEGEDGGFGGPPGEGGGIGGGGEGGGGIGEGDKPPPVPPTEEDVKHFICPIPLKIEDGEESTEGGFFPEGVGSFTRPDNRSGLTFEHRNVFLDANTDNYRSHWQSPFMIGFGGILAKPVPTILGGPDLLESNRGADDLDKEAHKRKSPITGQLFAFGGHLIDPEEPTYTQRADQNAKDFLPGTGPGGFVFLNPEVSFPELRIANELDTVPNAIKDKRNSKTSFFIGPGTKLRFNYPDLRNGEIYLGHSLYPDESTNHLKLDIESRTGIGSGPGINTKNILDIPDSFLVSDFIKIFMGLEITGKIDATENITTDKDFHLKSGSANEHVIEVSGSVAAQTYTFPGLISGPIHVGDKEVFIAGCEYDSNRGNFRVQTVGSAQNQRFTFPIPADFVTLVSLELICIPTSGSSQTLRDIDLFSDYGLLGQLHGFNSETNLTILFDLSGTLQELTAIDISTVFTSLAASQFCGIRIKHQSIGGDIDYIGVRLVYTPRPG